MITAANYVASEPPMATSTDSIVYIVDDDPAVRAGVSLLVRACGWYPRPCASAEEFLQNFSREASGCLILDLQMPGLSGADLADVMKNLGIDLPFIVVTAYRDHPLAERAKAAGALAVVSKHFRDEELVHRIQEALTRAD